MLTSLKCFSSNLCPPKENLVTVWVSQCLIISHHKTRLYLNTMQMYNKTNVNHPVQTSPSNNEAKCSKSVESRWIIEKLFAPNNDRLTQTEAYQGEKKVKWNGERHTYVLLWAGRWGLDLLCVVEKELATRGLGVPVDRKIGRELRLQTDTVSHSLVLFSLIWSVPLAFYVNYAYKQDL